MTPLDRAALAAALKDATPAVLRVDAEDMADLAMTVNAYAASTVAVFPHDRETFRRLAALALAVAEWNERPTRLTPFDNSWDDDSVTPLPWALRVPMTMGYTHHATLPAALADLLKGDQ